MILCHNDDVKTFNFITNNDLHLIIIMLIRNNNALFDNDNIVS